MAHNNKCLLYRDTTPIKSSKTPYKIVGIDVWESCDNCQESEHVMRAIFPIWWTHYDVQRFITGLDSATVIDFTNE